MPTNNLSFMKSILAIGLGLVMISIFPSISVLFSTNRGSSTTPITPITPIGVSSATFQFFIASDPPQHLTQIDWGTLSPGQNITKDIYITSSNASKTYRLSITTSRWGPAEAQEYMAFSENGTDQFLTARVDVRFTLEVFPNCTGITWFSFNINVNFEEV